MTNAQMLNIGVVAGYLLMIVGVGVYFARKKKDANQFMVAHQSIPGWAVGLSMFGSYISSISFLANPAQAYAGNWMAAAFTLVTPFGLLIGSTIFMRFYRRSNHVSAFTHLEGRFGAWARTYAVFTFLILQMARMGTILYLLSQAVLPLLGGSTGDMAMARTIIIVVGLLITFYTLFGGIEAVVWTGVVQSVVLIAGPIICLVTLLLKIPGGLGEVISVGAANDKFGFGPYTADLTVPTLWLFILTAMLEHLRNWGIDQSYIQRYISARSEKEAFRSIWIAGLLYMPVAFMFWFMGTALFAYYRAMPEALPVGTTPDAVFPHFIAYQVLPGLSGLVVAAIFAASMDSNLNSMATLTLVDGYKRYVNPNATDRQSMVVLWTSTFGWGIASIAWGLMMTLKGSTTTVQFMADIAGLLAGGLLGLFLLGLIWKRVPGWAAAISVTLGVLLITWITASRMKLGGYSIWPTAWEAWRSPWHQMTAGIFGTATVIGVGLMLTAIFCRRTQHPIALEPTTSADAVGR